MVQSAPAARLLELLPPRPPTPPRDIESKSPRLQSLNRIFSGDRIPRTPLQPTLASSAEFDNRASSKSSRKKVEWSAWTEYKDPPRIPARGDSTSKSTPRARAPSSDLRPKSILKPYNGVILLDQSSDSTRSPALHTFATFGMMLESITKQLAGGDRLSRLDGYTALSGTLKACDNVPDPQALKDKMGLLTAFVQRDITAKLQTGVSDTVLIISALTLLASFLYKPAVADSLPGEFCTTFLDIAMNALEDPQVPKDVVKHFMFILGQQNFSTKIMTADRAGQLITNLHDIEDHVTGKSIVVGRIGIYQKLLKQAKATMLGRREWLEDLLSDMLSSIKEIRSMAITFGMEAALSLGTEKAASRAVAEIFQLQHAKGKFADYYSERLGDMVSGKDDGGEFVPQIWTVVILFFRCRPQQLEQWAFMKPWLEIMQRCFNSGKHEIKVQANLAWNRLVFAIKLDEKTGLHMIRVLCQPVIGNLKRKVTGKNVREARQMAIASACNLLYYAFRPNAPAAQIDLYWDEYVVQLVERTLILKDGQGKQDFVKDDLRQAALILAGLLGTSKTKPWNENRANEGSLIKPIELPALEPQWVRKNTQRVLPLMERLIEVSFWDLHDKNSPISFVWQAYITSIATAGIKEIKVSIALMAFLARFFDLLGKVWKKGPDNLQAHGSGSPETFLKGFSRLVMTVIRTLGILPFTERMLSVTTSNSFTVVSTPSHRPLKTHGEVRSPIQHLFSMLAFPASGTITQESQGTYCSMLMTMINPFFMSRTNREGRLDMIKSFIDLVPTPDDNSTDSFVCVWRALANFTETAMTDEDESKGGSGSQPLGAEYKIVTKVLERCFDSSSPVLVPQWNTLFDVCVAHVTEQSGDGGRSIAVIEPLAKALNGHVSVHWSASAASYCRFLVVTAAFPTSSRSLDAAQRKLWGVVSNELGCNFAPYQELNSMLGSSLRQSYALATDDTASFVQLLTAIEDYLHRCPASCLTKTLESLQAGISIWNTDPDSRLGKASPVKAALYAPVSYTPICV